MKKVIIALLTATAACATPGAGKNEMTAAGHESAAATEERAGAAKRAADHKNAASQLREDERRACASLPLVERQTSPLAGLSVIEVKPLTQTLIVAEGLFQEVTTGASVVVRGEPNLAAGQLQRLLTCHIAHAELGEATPLVMRTCPLAVPGVYASVRPFGPGYAIEIIATETGAGVRDGSGPGDEVWKRASQLVLAH